MERIKRWWNKSFTKYICEDCSLITAFTHKPWLKELGLLGALWHKLKGHRVIRAWKYNLAGDVWFSEEDQKKHEEWMKHAYIPRGLPKPGSQIIKRGYGKHFEGKGKHQHKQYRKSVKAKIQPDEDKD